MHIPFIQDPATIGREDRLVRGCVALSLLLLGGFSILTAGGVALVPLVFLALAGYFTATSLTGRDPVYAAAGIDTRTDAELGIRQASAQPLLIDLTDDAEEPAPLRG